MSGASALCPTCTGSSDSGSWSGADWANIGWYPKPEENPVYSAKTARAAMEAAQEDRSVEGFVYPEYLASFEETVDADVVLDVGTGYYDANTHIKGAVPLFWEELLDDNNQPKSISEMSQVFGDAGISPDDSVVIYGDCPDCGGMSVATFVFWALRYLGHDDVKLLDGGLDAWKDAGLPVENTPNSLPAVTYTPDPQSGLLATYQKVTRGDVQLVDSRDFQDFTTSKIGDATHMGYQQVLENGRIKSAEDLEGLFDKLDRDKPVVVYSWAGAKASMVWFALQLLGYDASIYTWNDYATYQPSMKVQLREAWAEPDLAQPGSTVKIYAVFDVIEDTVSTAVSAAEPVGQESLEERQADGEEQAAVEEVVADDTVQDENDTKLEVMSCATCGPMVDSYLYGVDTSSSTTAVTAVALGASVSTPVTARAIVLSPEGQTVADVDMTCGAGNQCVGTWYAHGVSPGLYSVTLAASADGTPSYFEDVLTVEISESAPAQKTTNAPRQLSTVY